MLNQIYELLMKKEIEILIIISIFIENYINKCLIILHICLKNRFLIFLIANILIKSIFNCIWKYKIFILTNTIMRIE